MSTIKTAIELEVKEPNLKGFRQQLKQLTIEAQQAVLKFGEFSPEAVKAAQRVAQLKDQMEDFNDRVAAVNPDKFAQLNTVVSSVVNGFQAAQGAMVLLGGTTAQVEQTFVKLQAAMALSQGLEGLGRVQQQLRQIIASASTLQKVMAGTLGVVVLIAANFERLIGIIPGLEKLGSILKSIGFAISDFLGLGFREAEQYKIFKKANDLEIIEINKKIAILGTQERRERQIFEERRNLINAQLKDVQQQLALEVYADKEAKDELLKQQEQLNADLQILDAEQKAYEVKRQKEFEELKRKHNNELEKLTLENKYKIKDLDEYFYQSEDKRNNQQHLINLDKINQQYKERNLLLKQQKDEELKAIGDSQIRIDEINKYYDQLELDSNRKHEEELIKEQRKYDIIRQQEAIKTEQQIRDSKLQIAQSTVSGLSSLAQIMLNDQAKVTKAQKMLALVEIGIDTAFAVSSLNKEAAKVSAQMAGVLGPATPAFTAAYYAQGIARILANVAKAKQVLSQKNPNVSGAVGGGSIGSNIGGVAPSMVTGSSLPQDTGGGKVYVLEGDITRAQQRVNGNQRVSTVE